MPRPTRRNDLDDLPDDRPRGRTPKPPFAGTLMAAVGFGVTLIIGGVIGFAAGRSPREVEKPRSLEVAENTPKPVVKPPAATPPKPVPKPPVTKPTPTPKPAPPKPKPTPKPAEREPPEPEPKPTPKPPETTPKMSLVSFEKDVLPIFKGKCNLCHGDAGNPKGDLDLKTLARAVRGGDNGPGATPGKLDNSLIWTRIDDGTMPPKEKMTDAEKKTIKDWILSGAK